MLFGKTNAAEPSRFVREVNYSNIEIHEPDHGHGGYDYDYGYKQKKQNNYAASSFANSSFAKSERDGVSVPAFFSDSANRAGPRESPNLKKPTGLILQPQATISQATIKQATIVYKPNDIVEHSAFGRGVIQSVKAAGGDALLEILFDGDVTKRLMLKTAARYMKRIGD